MDINTTPLIDVMLVLLVMLIITIPIQLHAVNLNMPIGTPPPPHRAARGAARSTSTTRTHLAGTASACRTAATLEAEDGRAAAQPVQPEMHLRPDKDAQYEVVAGVLASSQRMGLTKIGVVGSEQFINE